VAFFVALLFLIGVAMLPRRRDRLGDLEVSGGETRDFLSRHRDAEEIDRS